MRVLREAQTAGGLIGSVLNQHTGQWEPCPVRRHAPVEPDPRFAGVRPAIKQAAPRAYKKHPAVPGSTLASQLARLRQAKQGQAMQTAQQYESGQACAPQHSSGAPSSAPGRVWHGHTVRGADAVALAAGRAARRTADALNMSGASGRAAAAELSAPGNQMLPWISIQQAWRQQSLAAAEPGGSRAWRQQSLAPSLLLLSWVSIQQDWRQQEGHPQC